MVTTGENLARICENLVTTCENLVRRCKNLVPLNAGPVPANAAETTRHRNVHPPTTPIEPKETKPAAPAITCEGLVTTGEKLVRMC